MPGTDSTADPHADPYDDPYGDPDLVTLYDGDNPDGVDHAYYRSLADLSDARTVIDLGCGTGLLTRSLATDGRHVIGVDPSPTMLTYARAQPGSDTVTWIDGDASSLPATATADLVVCTGNAIMHISPQALPATLDAVVRALRPGGLLAFETRNPAHRAWEHWTRDATYGERTTHLGRLREWLEVTSSSGGRVTFDTHTVLPDGDERVSTSVLHFRDEGTLRAQLSAAGFGDVRVVGGWRGEPVTETSRILVVTAVRRSPHTPEGTSIGP